MENYERKNEWKKLGAMWKKVVKSRGRGRDADAPAGGPRGPNSESSSDDECDYEDYFFDDTDDDVNSDDDDYNKEMTGDEISSGREEQGRTQIRKMMTHGGRMIREERGNGKRTKLVYGINTHTYTARTPGCGAQLRPTCAVFD